MYTNFYCDDLWFIDCPQYACLDINIGEDLVSVPGEL